MPVMKTAVYGCGSWGTAIAYTLARAGHEVALVGRDAEQIAEMRRTSENKKYLPGVVLPANLTPCTDLTEIATDVVFLAVPSHVVRETVVKIRSELKPAAILVNTAKGLEEGSHLRLSQVIEQEAPGHPVVALSGPSHAEEVSREVATAVVVASRDERAAEKVQEMIMTPFFRVYVNRDLIGVELGGALKNVIAICAGALESHKSLDNTKAALLTRGLTEMTRLGVAMGANAITFSGLSGLGDLIVTCTSRHSRNLRAGRALASGKTLTEVLDEIGMVVEGVRATRAAYELSRTLNISMPITEKAYQVLFENVSIETVLYDLMSRGKKQEYEDLK